MKAANNRAARIEAINGRTDFLAYDCPYSKSPMTGIKAGKAQSLFQVIVYDGQKWQTPMLVLTIDPPNSSMRMQDHLTPDDARTLAAGLIAAADHHDAITRREAAEQAVTA